MTKPKIPEEIKAETTELAEQLLKAIGKRKHVVAMQVVDKTQRKYTEPSN
jgi:hypothetical protein